jgi:hypothetical protein
VTKYHSKADTIDGIRFASQREGNRYRELKLLVRAGQIRDLELQPNFPVEYGGKLLFTYRGDFAYYENGHQVIEDVKGFKTAVYKLKKKIVEAMLGIKIIEI